MSDADYEELVEFEGKLQSLRRAAALDAADSRYGMESDRANLTRPAVIESKYLSTGTGQRRVANPIMFRTMLKDLPQFTQGSAAIKNPNPKIWCDPIGVAGVTKWLRNAAGYYIGAHIWVRVDMLPLDDANTATPPQNCRTLHYLTFSSRGSKALPTNVPASLPPREVLIALDQLRAAGELDQEVSIDV